MSIISVFPLPSFLSPGGLAAEHTRTRIVLQQQRNLLSPTSCSFLDIQSAISWCFQYLMLSTCGGTFMHSIPGATYTVCMYIWSGSATLWLCGLRMQHTERFDHFLLKKKWLEGVTKCDAMIQTVLGKVTLHATIIYSHTAESRANLFYFRMFQNN